MLIVDAHVHVWAAHSPERPWPKWAIGTPEWPRQITQRAEPVTKDEVLAKMNDNGVARAVIIPPHFEGDRNDLALEAARLHPDRFAVMGRLEGPMDENTPAMRRMVATWRERPGMLGMRLTFKAKPHRALLADRRADWLWAEAEKAGVPIAVLIDPEQIEHVDRIAERHPALKLVMDHLCLVSHERDAQVFACLDRILALAQRPNVAMKASALPCYSSAPYPYRNLHPYLRRIYDAFGPRRIFWGTDFVRLPCSYGQAITMITGEIPWLTTEDNEWIMGRGICEWIGWKLP